MSKANTPHTDWSARAPLTIGFAALALLIFVLGFWSVKTKIAGAIIASGAVVVETNRQVVQHAEGGIVGTIAVKDGDQVSAGQVLLKLDDTPLQTELAVVESQLIELRARRARLSAERDALSAVTFPPKLISFTQDEPSAREQIEGQRSLFFARRKTLLSELSQVDERVAQSKNQIAGVTAQLEALAEQKALISGDLIDQESLFERGLVQSQRVTLLKREAARLGGDIGKLTSDIAQFRGQIAAFEIEKLRLLAARREEAIVTLRDVQYRELELTEQHLGVLERISRTEILAPMDGVIYGSTVFALSSVVRPADPLMYVIPQDRPLVVSTRIAAKHIDQVYIGQSATLKFTAFNQRTTPETKGLVTEVSADIFEDATTGEAFYRVTLAPIQELPGALENLRLVPGMPVEAFLRTDSRTPLSYLTKPLTDYFTRAMRES